VGAVSNRDNLSALEVLPTKLSGLEAPPTNLVLFSVGAVSNRDPPPVGAVSNRDSSPVGAVSNRDSPPVGAVSNRDPPPVGAVSNRDPPPVGAVSNRDNLSALEVPPTFTLETPPTLYTFQNNGQAPLQILKSKQLWHISGA